MFKFKRRKNSVRQSLHNIEKRTEKVEQIIEELAQRNPEYHFTIDHVTIHNPILEDLTFRLDKLDIKELGGALNLGNNFGVRIGQEKQKQQKDTKEENEKQSSPHSASNKEVNMTSSRSGFSVKFPRDSD